MKILIPTAKELNLTAPSATPNPLSAQTQAVLDELATMSVTDLASFYKISPERAEVEWQAIQALREGTAQHAPALYLFDGLMYRHIRTIPRRKVSISRSILLLHQRFTVSSQPWSP